MIHRIFPALVTLTLLTTSATAQQADGLVTRLLEDNRNYNTQCRGGSGNDIETWQACGARDYSGYVLGQLGWCYGKQDEPAPMMQWHECTDGSIVSSLPRY